MSTTATAIIQGAFETIGVLGDGETISYAKAADGLRRLNLMMGSWALQPLTFPVIAREVFPLVDGQGTPDDPYTIGTGGDFDTLRPPTQQSIVGASLLLNSADPQPVETPIPVLTYDMYQANQVKTLEGTQATQLFYRPTYPLGHIFLYPIPNTTVNSLVLYLQKQLGKFAGLTTQYDFPEGAEEAIEYNLALRLCGPYSIAVDPDVKALARSSLAIYKRGNYKLYDLVQDPATTNSRSAGYDINTGNG